MRPGKRLRARFGCGGTTRAAVQERLLGHLRVPTTRAPFQPGSDELLALAPVLRLATGVVDLPGWDQDRILEVARWGGGLALVALSQRHDEEASAIVREASAFNLAVASFDTVVDELPRSLPSVAGALHPALLAARLQGGESLRLTGRAGRGGLEAIVALFDYTLASVSVRLRNDAAARDELGRLLRAMYESEVGATADPLLAKTLPTVFIGRIANPRGNPAVSDLFEKLARFIADWDDFQDLARDWARGRANRFLWVPALSPRFPTAVTLASGIGRLWFTDRATASVRTDLEAALERTLAAAGGGDLARGTEDLLFRLVSGRP